MKFAEKVNSKGYETEFLEQIVPGLGTRHQVRVGLYDTHDEALAALRQAEKDLNVVGVTVPVDIPTDS